MSKKEKVANTKEAKASLETERAAAPTPPKNGGRLFSYIRANLVAGLLVTLPLAITYFILKTLVIGLDDMLISAIPIHLHPYTRWGVDIHGVGLLAGLLVLFVAGLFARNLIGRRMLSLGEKLINVVPGVRSVYGAVKQVVDTVGQSNSRSFREVVLVEYPRKGIWAIAFVTGTTRGEVQKTVEDNELINVFLPTTPNPTSGFLLFVPKKDLIPLHMTIEQGMKMVISAGIITPSFAEGKAALKEEKAAAQAGQEAE